jgi:translation initiation factor IF-3
VLDRVCKDLAEIITVIQIAKMEGRFMAMTIGPNAKAQKTGS